MGMGCQGLRRSTERGKQSIPLGLCLVPLGMGIEIEKTPLQKVCSTARDETGGGYDLGGWGERWRSADCLLASLVREWLLKLGFGIRHWNEWGGRSQDSHEMYDPLEMGTGRGAAASAVVLRGWERDCYSCFGGAQEEVKLYSHLLPWQEWPAGS